LLAFSRRRRFSGSRARRTFGNITENGGITNFLRITQCGNKNFAALISLKHFRSQSSGYRRRLLCVHKLQPHSEKEQKLGSMAFIILRSTETKFDNATTCSMGDMNYHHHHHRLTISGVMSAKPWGVDPTGDHSYPLWNHPPPPGDTVTELSAVDNKPTSFISNMHFTSF